MHDECYRAVSAARIFDDDGRIARVVNALEWMSYDAGPTLLRWLAKEEPHTYRAFIEADRRSLRRLGHGNALASPYHHIILPLASRRDKVTEVRWGMEDFRRRFGREPEGMWLPEAAVDTETLDVLAAEGIRFTLLGPTQVEGPPPAGGCGRVRFGDREIAVFVYDGPLSHDVAFGAVLRDADAWARRLLDDAPYPLTVLATDGETFGHHHTWGDLALAAVLEHLSVPGGPRLENLASFLARNPPVDELRIVDPSSWSCAHGVDRWRLECGCKMAPHLPSQQKWRAVLREALDELADAIHERYEREAGGLLTDPWAARDAYGSVVGASELARRTFAASHLAGAVDDGRVDRALRLLDVEWDALRMFTSCGWFFDDIAGLEPLQVLRYAAHALDLLGPESEPLRARLLERLADAKSNDPAAGDARALWHTRVVVGTSTPPEARPADPLTRAVRASAGPGRSLDAALAEARVLERSGAEVPFEAQTALWRSFELADPPERRRMAPLLEALGFLGEPRPPLGSAGPTRFVFGLHIHQPVGNFDSVFREHVEQVYERFLARLEEAGALPVTMHLSGPLLDWLERRRHPFLDRVGRLAADGRLELLASGFWEPVLPALDRRDRIAQIEKMRSRLHRRFGVDATGLWLTERVWEPDLAADLGDAGIEYAFVDDRHFLVAGLEEHELHAPFRTESGGRTLDLLPIDERLRYLVPFRPPTELRDYLRALRRGGAPAAILADDGEKFGGWPGTEEWVWSSGWIDEFVEVLADLVARDEIVFSTGRQLLDAESPRRLAYLPTASYREMEGWSLPPRAARRMEALAARVAAEQPDSQVHVRGGHWRGFLARYPESNRMHKKAQRLSRLVEEQPDGARREEARDAVHRAQCNDVYWHGVFGGLYLRHLRDAVWASLAEAERILRAGQGLAFEAIDFDADGHEELWVHSEHFSALVAPSRGGGIEELSIFARGVNLANVLTRREEAYHRASPDTPPAQTAGAEPGGMPSIHELEHALAFESTPPFDRHPRVLLVERIHAGRVPTEVGGEWTGAPLVDGAAIPCRWERLGASAQGASAEEVRFRLTPTVPGGVTKTIGFQPDGTMRVEYSWDPATLPDDAWFVPELSLAAEARLEYEPEPAEVREHDIVTWSKSESGSEQTVQGRSICPCWPARLGWAALTVVV